LASLNGGPRRATRSTRRVLHRCRPRSSSAGRRRPGRASESQGVRASGADHPRPSDGRVRVTRDHKGRREQSSRSSTTVATMMTRPNIPVRRLRERHRLAPVRGSTARLRSPPARVVPRAASWRRDIRCELRRPSLPATVRPGPGRVTVERAHSNSWITGWMVFRYHSRRYRCPTTLHHYPTRFADDAPPSPGGRVSGGPARSGGS
jgi:hypothetical protein